MKFGNQKLAFWHIIAKSEPCICFFTNLLIGRYIKMSFKNAYLNELMERVVKRNPNEPEFHQTVKEVLESIEPVIEARPTT